MHITTHILISFLIFTFLAESKEVKGGRTPLTAEESIQALSSFFGSSGNSDDEPMFVSDERALVKGAAFPRGELAITNKVFQSVRIREMNRLNVELYKEMFSSEDANLLVFLSHRANSKEPDFQEKYKLAYKKFSKQFIWLILYGGVSTSVGEWDRHYLEAEKSGVDAAIRLCLIWNFQKQHPGEFAGRWTDRFEESFIEACTLDVSEDLLRTILHYSEEVGYLYQYKKGVEKFMKKVVRLDHVSLYVRQVFTGAMAINLAWKARGSGYAHTVTDEGWVGFHKHLNVAREALSQAWESRKNIVHAPYHMMTVAKGLEGGDEMRMWFDRTIAARLEYRNAYIGMYWGLLPRWYGSHRQMLDFANECFEQGMWETRVPVEFALLVHWYMRKDLESIKGVMMAPSVYEESKAVILEALNHKNCSYDHNKLRYYLLSMAYHANNMEDLKKYLQDLPSFDYPSYLKSTFGHEVAIFFGQINRLKREGATEEELEEKAELWLMVDSDPKEVLKRMSGGDMETFLHLDLLEKLRFTSDQKVNEMLIEQMKKFGREELGLMRMKELRDSGAKEEVLASLKKLLEALTSPFHIESVLLMPEEKRVEEPVCREIFKKMEELAKQYQVSSQEKALAQARIIPFVQYENYSAYTKEWGNKIKKVKDVGALLDMVTTKGHGTFSSIAYWNIFRNKNANIKGIDRFLKNWKSESPEAKEELLSFLRKSGLPGTVLEMANRLKNTPYEEIGEQWVLRIVKWWDKTLVSWRNQKMIFSYRAMQCFLKADGYQHLARKYALQHEPMTKSNSGKWLSAYLHVYADKPSLATKALIAGKYSRFKDSGRFDIPGHSFGNTKSLFSHILPMVTSHKDLRAEDLEKLKKEFPKHFK